MKLCKDCAHYKPDPYGHEFDRCMHGAETKIIVDPIRGKHETVTLDSFCEIRRESSVLLQMYKDVTDRVKQEIDEGTSTLELRYRSCGPEARYFVERPTVTIVTIPEHESRWERFTSWLRSWL